MADNTQLNSNDTAGDLLATKAVTHGGDSAKLQAVSLMGVSGTEGSYTIADINGDATNGLDVDVTRVGGNVTVVQATAANLNATVTVGAALPAGNSIVGQVKITDGTDVADVLDLSSSNPLAVAIVDTNGDQIASFGGGTQYTEDAAAAANPVGNMMIVVREDGRGGSLTTTDGDNVALRGNNLGELYVKHTDAITVNAHAVTNAGTFAVQAAQSGTWNVGTVTTVTAVTAISNALPAGANAIGKLAANSGVDIGDVDVTSVPTDPFGANADAASATGSISAKLRFIAGTGIPITGTVTVGSHAVTNAGTFVTQIDGSALTSLQLIDDPVIADDAAFTPATSKVMMAGYQADEASTDSVDEGDAGAARMTLDRKLIVTPQPHAAGGLSIYRSIDLDEGTLEVVKNSPGTIYGMWVTNTSTTTRWVKFYDATSGTAGTGTPVITIGIPGNASDDIAGNFGPGGMGIAFATGICFGATTGVADNDTGAPGANDVIANVFYK